MNKLFANFIWMHLPAKLHAIISNIFSIFFKTNLSVLIILPYCYFFGLNADYLSQFEPENANYHRIHSPAHLTVESIQNISGHLHFLRPWFYQKEHVSFPAVLNERVIIKLKDDSNKSWYIALVRGFGVGSVILSKNIKLGAKLDIGSEIGHFDLGSTVCIATPYKIKIQNYLQTVAVGQNLEITEEVNS